MRKVSLAASVAVLAGCSTMWPPVKSTVPVPPSNFTGCAKQEVQALGYKIKRTDRGDRGFDAQREDTTVRLGVQDRKVYDQLLVSVALTNGTSSQVQIVPGRVRAWYSRRGGETEDVPAPPQVQEEAKLIIAKCGS